MVQPASPYVTLEEFLVSEANDPSGVRREWIDGQVDAIAGATPEHGRLCSAVLAELRAALRGRCTVRDGPSQSIYQQRQRADEQQARADEQQARADRMEAELRHLRKRGGSD